MAAFSSGASINLGYTTDADESSFPPTAYKTINNPLSTDGVEVIHAASASSAAVGFGASASASLLWDVALGLADESVSFQLIDSSVQYVDADNLTFQELSDNNVIRLADGGPADNSAVTHIVSFLQLNDQDSDFNIVAFDNVSELFTSNNDSIKIGQDLANLFGITCPNNEFCSGDNCGSPCVATVPLQVFDSTALFSTPVTWSLATDSDTYTQEVIYTRYSVTTVDNSAFGITKGSTGTLHAFTCMWENADTEPTNETTDGDFEAYAAMFDFIFSSLRINNNEGLNYLEEALGIK